MDYTKPETLLGRTWRCECGREHTVPTQEIIYAADAIEQLAETAERYAAGKHAALIADKRTWAVAGPAAEQRLQAAGWRVHPEILPDGAHGGAVCDDATYAALAERCPEVDIYVAVGAGVVNDLTKWLAFERDRGYVALATAATMNGYTASNVAPTIDGVKRITFARAPRAVLATPEIIAAAPFELTAAGFGDVIAKPISTADWVLNHVFLDEYFCPACTELIAVIEPGYFDHPEAVAARDPQALAALLMALMYSGIAMTAAGTSAPASGGEHMLSHTLDMMASVDGAAHDLHGRQVGLGTLFAAALYERVLAMDEPRPRPLPGQIDAAFWGPLAEPVNEQYQLKLPLMEPLCARLADRATWDEFRGRAGRQVRSAAAIKQRLRAAGAAHCWRDIGCDRERLLSAVRHMHEIRQRPTVVDMAWTLGILPDAAEELVDSWFGD